MRRALGTQGIRALAHRPGYVSNGSILMKKLSLVLIALSFGLSFGAARLPAQSKAKPATPAKSTAGPAKPSALDKTVMENYVRHLQAWDRSISIDVGDPKPGPIDSLLEVTIHAHKDKASQDLVFYVTRDGKHI